MENYICTACGTQFSQSASPPPSCPICHAGTAPDIFGARLPLALNSNVHSARPDNLIRVILDGMADPANPARGAMPAFRSAFDDRQLAELVSFIRRTQAPDKPAWTDLPAEIARIRGASRSAL